MHVLRGRRDDPEADRELTAEVLGRTAETGARWLRVWQPPRQLAFGRRDARAAGYQRAREIAIEHGFPPLERMVGGQAVAYTGTTVAVAVTFPVAEERTGIEARYEEVTMAIQRALWRLGAPVQRGEPDDPFCPGTHSLSWRGKIAGIAQRIQPDAALVGGVVIPTDHEGIAAVLEPIYDALDLPFSRESVGSIERAGGRPDPATVLRTLEAVIVGDDRGTVEEVARG